MGKEKGNAFVLVTELPSREDTLISAHYWIQVWENVQLRGYDWHQAREVTTAQTCLKICTKEEKKETGCASDDTPDSSSRTPVPNTHKHTHFPVFQSRTR